eukprot:TRINITY_DN51224_c0_g1_i1.p1 TRINITY_DN51224_c0_g1~~TRINITY_DN51224_c0_g1_i1.p1  ORF type:complete len:286 (-),score=51.44 TRINITY_DN51224_c0_g1_i1:94-894(-)
MAEDFVVVPLACGGTFRFAVAGCGPRPSGCRLWTSSVTLAGAVEAELSTCVPALRGASTGSESLFPLPRRVLELAAGAGVPSIVAAGFGCADVTVSDCEDEALRILRGNVKRFQTFAQEQHPGASSAGNIAARRLDFSDPGHVAECAGATGFDFVLAADCCYEMGAAERLATAVNSLLAPSGLALLADRDRPGCSSTTVRQELCASAARRGLAVEELDVDGYFQRGLDVTGVPKELLSGCVDGRSFLLRIARQPRTSRLLQLDAMD